MTRKTAPSPGHALLKVLRGYRLMTRTRFGQPKFLEKSGYSIRRDFTAQHFHPKVSLYQAPGVIVLEVGACKTQFGPHPWVEQA